MADTESRLNERAAQAAQAAQADQTGLSSEAAGASGAQSASNSGLQDPARREQIYRERRATEVQVLAGLSLRARFEPATAAVNFELQGVLDRMFDPLYLYSELPISIVVSSNDLSSTAGNTVLSRDRGQAIAAYLISRGLDVRRIRIYVEPTDGLLFGTHRVRVLPEDLSQ